uniref:SF3 helicase domain-containing protein n=1 Tax=Pyramimonas orientalis virus TaxID=455367 RepID=A0A7M3UNX3_POV01|nr:hypothetical protein HWQ62_00280 [Pyramimonas orientalis virus]
MSNLQYKRRVVDFLNRMKSVKESTFTHTSITEPAGSFYLKYDDMLTFNDLYKEAMKNDCDLYLTEKHRDISPVLIDLDLRFEKNVTERQYSLQMIEEIVKMYIEEIKRYVELPCFVNAYVMEKSNPVYVEKKDIVKDGIHIILTNVVTRPSVQFIVRKNLLKRFGKLMKEMNLLNSIEDVFDEQVIFQNNWQMYGSKKPNNEAYKVTYDMSYNVEDKELVYNDVNEDDTHYVDILSIRNKYNENNLKQEFRESVVKMDKEMKDAEDKKEQKKHVYNKIIQNHESNFKPSCEELNLVKKLLVILNPKRAIDYCDWIRLGWCLRNIDIDLLAEWDEFSKKSTKYEAGACDLLWYRMKEGGLGIGTLHMWAKQDNPEKYNKLVTEDISSLIYKSLSLTDYDIALVIARMFRHRFRCASHKHHIWYEFEGHGWKEKEKGYTLFYKEIPTLLFNEYMKAIEKESARARNGDDREMDICAKNIEKLTKISLKLKSTSFVKDKMYKECSGLFYEPKFEEKLDSNPKLLGFENGVYDLDNDEFREGRPEDYISMTTGINYIEYDVENPYVDEVDGFMRKVLTNDNVREYVWTLFASILDGTNRDEKFHIWTGSGSNGKSKIVELFQHTIGDYACIFNVSLLTQKRVGSNATNSELAIAKGKRFAILQEPEENERLNVGLMKELTGGDQIQCRCLFKEPIRFKPMFKMILTCNHMPAIPPDDGGTWRRVRRVEYTSKFVDDPNPNNEHEFRIDRELGYKFELWKETFMAMLLRYYKLYKKKGKIVEPREVMEYTYEYQRKNDVFADFCDTVIAEDAGAAVDVTSLFERFKEYCNADNIKNKAKKSTFQEAMEKRYGKLVLVKGVKCWKGIKLVEKLKPEEDEDEQIHD